LGTDTFEGAEVDNGFRRGNGKSRRPGFFFTSMSASFCTSSVFGVVLGEASVAHPAPGIAVVTKSEQASIRVCWRFMVDIPFFSMG